MLEKETNEEKGCMEGERMIVAGRMLMRRGFSVGMLPFDDSPTSTSTQDTSQNNHLNYAVCLRYDAQRPGVSVCSSLLSKALCLYSLLFLLCLASSLPGTSAYRAHINLGVLSDEMNKHHPIQRLQGVSLLLCCRAMLPSPCLLQPFIQISQSGGQP